MSEMENSKEPAFPLFCDYGADDKGHQSGLTKREYFAGLAMQAILTHSISGWNYDELAEQAIKTADELLKQLEP